MWPNEKCYPMEHAEHSATRSPNGSAFACFFQYYHDRAEGSVLKDRKTLASGVHLVNPQRSPRECRKQTQGHNVNYSTTALVNVFVINEDQRFGIIFPNGSPSPSSILAYTDNLVRCAAEIGRSFQT